MEKYNTHIPSFKKKWRLYLPNMVMVLILIPWKEEETQIGWFNSTVILKHGNSSEFFYVKEKWAGPGIVMHEKEAVGSLG